jgi:hypothetical protein
MAADCPAFFSYTGGILTNDCVSGEPDQSVCSVSQPTLTPLGGDAWCA